MLHHILTYFNQLPPHTVTTVLSFLVGALGLSVTLQVLKKKLNFQEAQKLVIFLTAAFSYIGAGANYIVSHAATSPLPTIAGNGSKLMALAVIVHRFLVSPAYSKIETQILNLVKDANAYRAEVSAAKPAEEQPQQFTV